MEKALLENNVMHLVFLNSGKYICAPHQVEKTSHLFADLGYRENRMRALIKDLETAYNIPIPANTAYQWNTPADIINYVAGQI